MPRVNEVGRHPSGPRGVGDDELPLEQAAQLVAVASPLPHLLQVQARVGDHRVEVLHELILGHRRKGAHREVR